MGGVEKSWAIWADAFTLGRLILAIPLLIFTAAGDWALTVILLSIGWWSDFFDGRLARRSSQPTRLGAWDMTIDTIVGASLVVGLVLGGHLPWWIGVVGAALAVAAAWSRNFSLAMLLQALGYGPVLWFALPNSPIGLTVAVATIAIIAVIDRQQLVEWTLPTFFKGLAGRRTD